MWYEQANAVYRNLLDPIVAADLELEDRVIRRGIAEGRQVRIAETVESVKFFNGDGHEHNFIGERGLQTRMSSPSGRGGGARSGVSERDFAVTWIWSLSALSAFDECTVQHYHTIYIRMCLCRKRTNLSTPGVFFYKKVSMVPWFSLSGP